MPQGVALVDLECYKGEDFSPPFQVDSAWTADITGWSIVATVKTTDAEATPEETITCTVTDGPNRIFVIPFTAAITAALLVGTAYVYDVWRTDAGFHWVLALGNFKVKTERRVLVP